MTVSPELVDHISKLSRLELEAGEKQAMAERLEQIVAFMDVLNRLDTTGVEPLSHVFPVRNVLREDEAAPCLDRGPLLAGSPAADGGLFWHPGLWSEEERHGTDKADRLRAGSGHPKGAGIREGGGSGCAGRRRAAKRGAEGQGQPPDGERRATGVVWSGKKRT